MHLYGKEWYFYYDDSDGGLARTNPDDIDHVDKGKFQSLLSQEDWKEPSL